MSLTLTPPTRVLALVGALVLTGLAAVVFLLARGAIGGEASPSRAAPVSRTAPSPAAMPEPSTAPRARQRAASGFPPKIDRALRYKRVVVVSVWLPGAAVDRIVRQAAKRAATETNAGFVTVNAADERAISGLVAKTGVLPSPAVVIVKRPGSVSATFSVTDAGTIVQAVVQARR